MEQKFYLGWKLELQTLKKSLEIGRMKMRTSRYCIYYSQKYECCAQGYRGQSGLIGGYAPLGCLNHTPSHQCVSSESCELDCLRELEIEVSLKGSLSQWDVSSSSLISSLVWANYFKKPFQQRVWLSKDHDCQKCLHLAERLDIETELHLKTLFKIDRR